MNIPIYIPSYGRHDTIKTPLYLSKKNVPYKVLLHTNECKEKYLKGGRVDPRSIIVTGAKRGVTNQRNWLVDNLAKLGEWYITLDDNIGGFKRVVDKYYSSKKKLDVNSNYITQADYNQKVEADEMVELFKKDILVAEKIHAEYTGFATVDNYFFNSKKYKPVGYVISKASAIKHQGLRYDEKILAMDDYGFTAQQLVRNHCVLINSWVKPIAGHYEKGGIGTYEERVPKKRKDAAYLIKKYPGLFRYKKKSGCDALSELQIRFHSVKQVERWLNENPSIK